MLRTCYRCLVRLHPAPFRRRFGDEMLAVFDEDSSVRSAPRLFIDAVGSLFRQWLLRSEFRRATSLAPSLAMLNAPALFSSLETYKLPPAAVLSGSLISLALLCAITVGIARSGSVPAWLIGTHRPSGDLMTIARPSLAEAEPNTLVRIAPEPDDPWRAVAGRYFKIMPVLGALDANRDFVLSPWEIFTAPAALKKFDRNHDGRLTAEECGFNGPAAFRMRFMRSHPVLAALDADHDGEISAEEIMNSAKNLLQLDRNGDGFLTPDEVVPQ
jgi:hypothetical protein